MIFLNLKIHYNATFCVLSPHTIRFQIGPKMANQWPFYTLENIFYLCARKTIEHKSFAYSTLLDYFGG